MSFVLDVWSIWVLVLSHLKQKNNTTNQNYHEKICHWEEKIWHGQQICLKLTQPKVWANPHDCINVGDRISHIFETIESLLGPYEPIFIENIDKIWTPLKFCSWLSQILENIISSEKAPIFIWIRPSWRYSKCYSVKSQKCASWKFQNINFFHSNANFSWYPCNLENLATQT